MLERITNTHFSSPFPELQSYDVKKKIVAGQLHWLLLGNINYDVPVIAPTG